MFSEFFELLYIYNGRFNKTDFHFPNQRECSTGKVRDVYNINDELIVMVATDRISAFDVILPKRNSIQGQ